MFIKRKLLEVAKVFGKIRHYKTTVLCLLLTVSVCSVTAFGLALKTVNIFDGENATVCYTFKDDPYAILTEEEIDVSQYDKVEFSGFEGNTGVINITRAISVYIKDNGNRKTVYTTAETVKELLDENNIYLGQYDTLNLPMNKVLITNDNIVIDRISYESFVEYEEIPYETEYKVSSLLRKGREKLLASGEAGQKSITYKEKIVNGVVVETTIEKEETIKEATDALVLRGGAAAVSELNFGVPLNANGVPVAYKEVLTNQVAMGYTAREGAKGASRMVLEAGYVAVRADEIPYGTKMYITSPDNSFIYGFAIAADTGVALMNNAIDVDLFYDSYIESCLNGRKNVNIYIL